MASKLGRTLLIANPAAQNGNGIEATAHAEVLLEEALGSAQFKLALTVRPNHATDIAANAQGFDTIIALGGDGIIHEVANGLMKQDKTVRPALAIIPVGSGNDYARSLGMPKGVKAAYHALLTSKKKPIDIGVVNGNYFVETLSFGLDAAIALDTVERRTRSGHKGALLYMASGFDQLAHHLSTFSYEAIFDNKPTVQGRSFTFAVQIGPYYGGGFKVCPNADMNDGMLDICISHPPINALRAVLIFLMAKSGKHTKTKPIEMLRARNLSVRFNNPPPAQMDGERIESTTFNISVERSALQVFIPQK